MFSTMAPVGSALKSNAFGRISVLTGLATLALFSVRGAIGASAPAVEAANGMIASAQHLASEAGIEILKQGGNAIDAAVAVGYAEAVVNPCCGNIGGGGFMVVHFKGRNSFINFREMAPAAATPDMFLDTQKNVIKNASLYGYKAVAIPGTVMGLDTALREYGSLPRFQVMAAAIKLAREGFVLQRGDTNPIDLHIDRIRRQPNIAKIFLRPDGTPLEPGDRLVQSDLANTLEAIASNGPDAFYRGRIPNKVEDASRAAGGILKAADFASYHVTEGPPLTCTYRGYTFVSAPPPSSGGTTMCEVLNVLEGYNMREMGFHSAQAVHLMAEAMRHAFLDRNTYLGDPAFVQNPLDRLLSKDYAAAIRARILPDKATPSPDLAPGVEPHEKTETTHYSVVDKAGNAASVTYTLDASFGAMVMAGDTGFLLNDEMDDFTAKPGVPNLPGLVQGTTNAIMPGKRPLSSMAPTLVIKDGRVFLVLGSRGGPRIITVILETAMNIIDYGMEPQEAVDAPRIHHQWLPDELFTERFGLSPDTVTLLQGMGYRVTERAPWGAVELIAIGSPATIRRDFDRSRSYIGQSGNLRPDLFFGANDARVTAGAAVGY
jgi:gamma-glutamyltranspeptidase / glutathione hydrolase